ncbi:MAG: DUF4405 domain-containing protein [Mycobacteriales bacterium]
MNTVTPRAARLARGELVFDAALLVAFTLVYAIGFTGQAIHEWLGVSIGAALVVHLTLHWDWVLRISRNLVSRRGRARIPWLINLMLLAAMTLCVISGIYLSVVFLPAIGLSSIGPQGSIGFWRRTHSLTANLTLILVPIHVAMDWRWIVGVTRNVVRRRRAGAAA